MSFLRTLLFVFLAFSLLATGQDKSKGKAGDKEKPAAGMPAMTPPPEIQKLAKSLVGTYTTKETHDPSPMMPNGGTGTGRATFLLGPGGNSILETYQSQSSMGKFRGHGVVWYDEKAGGYRGVWCDSMSPACDTGGVTKWEGDTLVGTNQTEMMGKKFSLKQTMSNFNPAGFKFDMEMSEEGGPMKHAMTIEYTKAAAVKPAAEKK